MNSRIAALQPYSWAALQDPSVQAYPWHFQKWLWLSIFRTSDLTSCFQKQEVFISIRFQFGIQQQTRAIRRALTLFVLGFTGDFREKWVERENDEILEAKWNLWSQISIGIYGKPRMNSEKWYKQFSAYYKWLPRIVLNPPKNVLYNLQIVPQSSKHVTDQIYYT